MEKEELKVKEYMRACGMAETPGGIVMGVSGGADSVALLFILRALFFGRADYPLYAIHVNHGIRGAEADRDENFVRALCERCGIPLTVCREKVPAYAKEHGLTEEEAGRELRYRAFACECEKRNAAYIAVAHNQNDVAETMLFHMARGSSLHGMAGVPAVRGNIIRPIMCLKRTEIEAYLARKGESFCEDSTNADATYDRNRLRHNVLTELCRVNAGAVEHIAELAEHIKKADDFIQAEAERALDKCNVDGTFLVTALADLPEVVRDRAVYLAIASACGAKKDITGRHVAAVQALLTAETGSRADLPYGMCARRSYDRLVFEPQGEEGVFSSVVLAVPGETDTNLGGVVIAEIISKKPISFEKKIYTKYFDYDKIKGALCARTPDPEDALVIDLAGHTKKLSRIFIDNKVDRIARLSQPVIAYGDSVLWAVGLRYNEAYRVTDETENILRLEFRKV